MFGRISSITKTHHFGLNKCRTESLLILGLFSLSLLSHGKSQTPNTKMASNPSSMWSDIVKKDPPSKPSPSDGAPAAIPGIVGNCKSRKGISTAVVDASAFIEGDQTLTKFADTFVTVPEVLSEILDHVSRSRLDFIPLETREPSDGSISKGT